MTGAAGPSGSRLLQTRCSWRRKVSTSAGEKETDTSTLPPAGMVPCAFDAEKGASASGSGSREPSAAVVTFHL